jgi:2-polyprenyl-3-methyl-5-hydroxy-6-metoxy-1,4-benzoquinol methylase
MIKPIYDQGWSQEVKVVYQHDIEQYWDKSLSIHEWNQYQNLLAFYSSLAPPEKTLDILDVGCAQATLALLLAERGHNVTAVDIRKEFLDYAASRHEFGEIEFIQGNVLELSLEKKYDLIYANQIIEHLVYPREMIDTLRSMLRIGGRLVITTPNWAYMMSSLPSFNSLGDPKQWENKQFTADGDGHFYAYKRTELHEIFYAAGFRNIDCCVYETPIISGHIKMRYLHKFMPLGMLVFIDKLLLKIPLLSGLLSHQLMVVGTK